MLNRLFNTLFGKLFAGFCLVILLTAAGVWMAAYSAQSQQNEDIGRIEWRFIAHKSVDSAVGIYEVAGRDGLISWLRNERLNTNPIVFVLDSSGREISGRKLPDKAYESLKAIRKLTDDPNGPPEKRLPVRTVEIDNEPCEFFAVRTVAFPVRLIPPELHHFPIALTLSLAAFFTLLVSWLLARLYTRSLHTLDGAMRRFADGAFDTRTSEELARGDAEVANLARVFDGMADKIESLITRQRRLFHDVSHEVRSPLARIEVALELARRDPARTQDSLGRIEKEVGNINALVESLLTYARLENGANMTKSPVGLADILEGVADDLGFEAQQKNVTVKTVLEGGSRRRCGRQPDRKGRRQHCAQLASPRTRRLHDPPVALLGRGELHHQMQGRGSRHARRGARRHVLALRARRQRPHGHGVRPWARHRQTKRDGARRRHHGAQCQPPRSRDRNPSAKVH